MTRTMAGARWTRLRPSPLKGAPMRQPGDTASASGRARMPSWEHGRAPPTATPGGAVKRRDGKLCERPRSWLRLTEKGNFSVKGKIGTSRVDSRIGRTTDVLKCPRWVVVGFRARDVFSSKRVSVQGAVFGTVRDNGRNQRQDAEGMHARNTHSVQCAHRGYGGISRQRDSRPSRQHATARDTGQADSPVWVVSAQVQEAAHAAAFRLTTAETKSSRPSKFSRRIASFSDNSRRPLFRSQT